jgi:recombination protein RecT
MSEPSNAVQKSVTVKSLVESAAYQKRFKDVLGSKAPQFVSSLVQISQSWNLEKCQPNSVIAAAMVAAALDLPINPNLGFAYIIPYKDRASFQMGYKGFIQLGQRSGQYKHLNACEVFDGDLVKYDRLKGEVALDEKKRKKDAKIIGYAAYFQLVNGHEHGLYWTTKEVEAHADRYSQSYRAGTDSPWKTNFDQMAMKTVLKKLLSTWGPMSIQMQTAVERDQSIEVDGEVMYPDNERPVENEAPPVFGQDKPASKAKGKPAKEHTPREPKPDAKAQVIARLTAAKVTFDDFADYIVNQNIDAKFRDNCIGYETMPLAVCEVLIAAPKHLDTIVKTYGAK